MSRHEECWLCSRDLDPATADTICNGCGRLVCTYHAIEDECLGCVEEREADAQAASVPAQVLREVSSG